MAVSKVTFSQHTHTHTMNNNQGYGSITLSVSSEQKEQHAAEDDQISDINRSSATEPVWSSSKYLRWILIGCSALAVASYSLISGDATDTTITTRSNSFVEMEEARTTNMLGGTHPHHTSVLLDAKYDETELFYQDQLIDHIHETSHKDKKSKMTYSQRYYKKSQYWKGPGYPILFLVGGEASLEPPMLFPFVNEGLAQEFGAYVVSPELRFYGKSQPVENPTNEQLVKYLTPDQALADSISILGMIRDQLGCSMDPTSHEYCPVITFGGSYPGFLSAMMRFRFPDIVDISYASSAPLKTYSQEADPNAYFDKVTQVAETASPGCANAVRSTMVAVRDELLANYTSVAKAAKATGFCQETVPHYIKDIPTLISETITYLVPAIFADFNMAYYPPGPTTEFERACSVFQDSSNTAVERIVKFFQLRGEAEYGLDDNHKTKCFDLSLELPNGPHARIRGSDNSGTGGGLAGEMWDFQCCKDLVVGAGYSEQSMFLPRPFDYDWHTHHCQKRFKGVPVEPFRMVNQWGFNDLSQASRILFTVSEIVSSSSNPSILYK